MFARIFNIHQKKVSTPEDNEKLRKEKKDEFQGSPRLPKLEKKNIRVLIFKDCEWKADKNLLFDSDAIISIQDDNVEKDKCSKQKDFVACSSPSQKYQRVKPNGDVKMLGEMIFGSVAMAYKGSVLKVHLMRTPPQLMMTKVFALRSRSAGVNFCDNELILPAGSIKTPQISITGDSGSMDSRHSSPTDMRRTYSNPIGMKRQELNHSCNSLYASNASTQSTWSIASADGLSRSSCVLSLSRSSLHSPCGSYKRRFVRSKRTSLDSSHIWRTKSEVSEEMRSTFKQQPKIGVGVIFKLWDFPEDNKRFQDFFFSHYTLFEAHLQVLRVKIEKSFYLRQKFVDAAMNAIECFKDDIMSLCYASRILEPVWLNLMVSVEQAYYDIVDKFIKSFINMAGICETKENNYFLSILLTAVLTHHASWVATVMSSGSEAKRAYLDKHSSKALDILAKCHPYNPLWAQLCDLYGSNGSPVKLTRTIIVGKNSDLVCELLHILSYFIRCSEVKENILFPVRERDALYRFSGSSWNESHLSVTPNSVRSWIDANDVCRSKFDETYDNHSEVPQACCHDKSNVVCDGVCRTEHNTCQHLFDLSFDINVCYCSKMRNFDKVEKKNLLNKIHLCESEVNVGNQWTSCSANHQASLLEFCENCHNLQKYLSHDGDICHHCTQSHANQSHEKKEKDVKKVLFFPNTNVPSFKCYCCTPEDVYQGVQIIDIDHTLEDDITPRARNMSDPVDCVVGSKFKTGLLRNSTTSQDSGTEMACSVVSSVHDLDSADSISLSRNDSICSRDGQDQILPDMDSDYYSVDNEHVASTLTNSIYVEEPQENEHLKVSKSCSSTTLKEVSVSLSTSLERSEKMAIAEEYDLQKDNLDEQDKLDEDLELMNLIELPLLRTSSKPPRKQSRCSENDSITFGKSLFAGYNEHYLPNVVLQGVETLDTKRLATDLQNTVKHSVLDEQVTNAVCIVADTDTWSCDLWSFSKKTDPDNGSTSESLHTSPLYASALVSTMIESTKELWDINMAPHFCLLHLEEQLKDIYNRSKVYDMYRLNNRDGDTFMNSLGYHANDIELLTALSTANDTQMSDDSFL